MIKLIAFEASLWFEEKNVWCINKGTEKNNTGRERVLYLDGPLLQSPWATDSIQLNNSLSSKQWQYTEHYTTSLLWLKVIPVCYWTVVMRNLQHMAENNTLHIL